MSYSPRSDLAKKHEEFKSRLVDDVFGKETGKQVPMEKVVMLMWQFRDDPTVVQFMAQFVAKYSGTRDVFDGIEFYLPQLAHMIIHLEVSWDDAILERFALIVSQQSLHFALQLNWILHGAIEDYQPENPDGTANESYNPLFYSRCVKLLSNIERCVVYGTPRTHELQRLYELGKISKKEYELMEQADRRFNAAQIVSRGNNGGGGQLNGVDGDDGTHFGGELLYKRKVRTAPYKRKNWKVRYFSVVERMLYCHNHHPNQGAAALRRAMPLEGAEVGEPENPKYEHMFFVSNQHFVFVVRASSKEEKQRWLRVLKKESEANALYPHRIPSKENGQMKSNAGEDEMGNSIILELTPSQRSRYDFFKDERDFVYDMCDVAEDLRFKDRDERKKLAPGLMADLNIPKCAYVPMKNSSHTWQRVAKPIPNDTRVFNTKERCPVIMYFVTKRGETLHSSRGGFRDANLDVAEYLHLQYEVPDESATTKPAMAGIDEGDEELGEEGGVMVGNHSDLFYSCADGMDAVGQLGLAGLGEEEEVKQKREDGEDGDGEYPEDAINTSRSGGAMLWSEESKFNLGEQAAGGGGGGAHDGKAGGGGGGAAGAGGGEQHRGGKGNIKVQRLMKENLVNLPQNLAKRIKSKRHLVGSVVNRESMIPVPRMPRKGQQKGHQTFLDKATGTVDSVPIVESLRNDADDDEKSVSSLTGSVLTNDGSIVHIEGGLDGIDRESLGRAKAIIARGESWADKSARMLREEEGAAAKDGDGPAGAAAAAAAGGGGEDSAICTEIISVMAKSNDDLRQEVFIMQMIHFYKSVFAKARLPIWLKTYRILSTASSTGLIEVINDATSIDGLKKAEGYPSEGGMRAYFEAVYGKPDSHSFKAAQRNFMLSLVGYSLMSYLLGLKDRHNGNIMIDLWGHIIHIDFGFVMGMAPGHEFSMERAPFKMTPDYLEVMGGIKSDCFAEFKRLFVSGLEAARSSSLVALGLVEIMMFKSNYPCFTGSRYGGGRALKSFEKRLMLNRPDKDIPKFALGLIESSIGHNGTYLYDRFQLYSNGYAM